MPSPLPMRHFLRLALIASITICSAFSAAPQDDITAATQSWADAFNSRQMDRVLAQYAPDAVLWGTRSQIVRDTPALIREYFSNMPTQPHTRVALGESRIRVLGDVAISTGYYTFTGRDAEGKPTTSPARHTFVFAKRDSRWIIVEHHSSTIPPPR
jgi:uncharacterized protein (TIGR02246 family)